MIMGLIDLIIRAVQWICNLVEKIIVGVLNFAKHIVGWFRGLNLNPNRHVPFIADKEKFKQLLTNAPVKKVGVFKGVYDQVTDEISNSEYIGADSLDQQTKNILANEDLVVLN